MSIEHGEKAVLIQRRLGNRINRAEWLRHLSYIYSSIGDYERAVTLAQESLALAISLDARKHVAEALNLLAETARLQQKFSEANDYYREALAIANEMGDAFETSFILSNMGTAFVGRGDLSLAVTVLRESTGINRRAHRDNAILSWNLWMLAEVAERNGDAVRAARLHGAAESLGQFPGFYLAPADIEDIERQAVRVRSQLGKEAYVSAWLGGRAMSLDEIFAYALEEPI
jgi:tetratricopeptide (TPR) repeat protein